MRLLVLGGSGSLGSVLIPAATERGAEVVAPPHHEFDITNLEHIGQLGLRKLGKFDWVLNLAGYTNVDGAESEIQTATELNVLGPGYLAKACSDAGIRLAHVSTDCVFGGDQTTPYLETDKKNPLGVYGRTKSEGEEEVLQVSSDFAVIRVAWLYGPTGKNLVRAILQRLVAGLQLRVVNDQVGSPTYTVSLSETILDYLSADGDGGIYHAAGPATVNRYDQAKLIAEVYEKLTGKLKSELIGISTEESNTAAKRPSFSALDSSKILKYSRPSPPYEETIVTAIQQILPTIQ